MARKLEIKLPPEAEAASVEHHKCGITSVIINLSEKTDYSRRVDTRPGDYKCFDVMDEAGNYRKSLYVPTGRLAPGVWADTRNKDQHVFYHIPLELLKERIPA